jgi:hypothetical protein
MERADLNAGLVAAAVYNVNRDAKKRPQPYSAADVMIKFEPPKKTIKGAKPDAGALLYQHLQLIRARKLKSSTGGGAK